MTNLITSYAQLKSVMLALMISDASQVAHRLDLPGTAGIRTQSITLAFVHDPRRTPTLGLGGVFDTENWVFSYPRGGKLAYIICKKPHFWATFDPTAYKPFAVTESQIDTNRAVKIAQEYLEKIPVDVPRLNRECWIRIRVTRIRGMVIPEYAIVWMRGSQDVASVLFMERPRKLWQIRVEDPSFVLRPSITDGLVVKLPPLRDGPGR
jgi:hypothetical protein